MLSIDEKRQHNLGLPISCIPKEILLKIFSHSRNNYIGEGRHHGTECLNGWIGITYVCHEWREMSLNDSLLWCHIDILHSLRSWIPEQLRRSKQSPLTVVVIESVAQHAYDLLVQVHEHFCRVRELVLDNPRLDTWNQIFLSYNTQSLEALEIYLSGQRSFVLNDTYLRGEGFRRLILHNCPVDWNSKWFLGLTHLKLVDMPDDCKLGCHDFKVILSKIPALETLHLYQIFREEEHVQTHHPTKVHLRHLQQLDVDHEIPEMAQFLSYLLVPRSCKLRITTGIDASDEFCAIVSWVSNQLRVPAPSLSILDTSGHEQYIRSFHLTYNPDMMEFELQGFCDVLSHEGLITADPILKFIITESDADDTFDFNLTSFLSLLPLSGVVFLDVYADLDVFPSPEFWTVPFGSIQTLTTAHLEAETSAFWEALIPVNSNDGTVKSLPFSALVSVTVDDSQLDPQILLDKLRVRSELFGTQLQELRFLRRGCVPPAPLMIQLKELVPNLRVAGTLDPYGSTNADDRSFNGDDED